MTTTNQTQPVEPKTFAQMDTDERLAWLEEARAYVAAQKAMGVTTPTNRATYDPATLMTATDVVVAALEYGLPASQVLDDALKAQGIDAHKVAPQVTPAWATDVTDVSDGPTFKRRLEAHASLATTAEVIVTSGGDPYRFGFELIQHGDGAVLLESDELPADWFMFADPGTARVIALALLDAANEWQAITDQELRHALAGNLTR